MIEPSGLSARDAVRRLTESDAGAVLAICRENPQFYQYCQARPTREQVLSDMRITPPGIDASRKYFVGFYEGRTLVAVMDIVDGYPADDIAYIGFFMMDAHWQGRGIGTAIVQDALKYLKSTGKTAVRLGIDKGNPQSTHFWEKNGFTVIRETDKRGWPFLEAERRL